MEISMKLNFQFKGMNHGEAVNNLFGRDMEHA
jgi:hypothetical protein